VNLQEGVLGDIKRVFAIADDTKRDGVDLALIALNQETKGLVVSILCTNNEVFVGFFSHQCSESVDGLRGRVQAVAHNLSRPERRIQEGLLSRHLKSVTSPHLNLVKRSQTCASVS